MLPTVFSYNTCIFTNAYQAHTISDLGFPNLELNLIGEFLTAEVKIQHMAVLEPLTR